MGKVSVCSKVYFRGGRSREPDECLGLASASCFLQWQVLWRDLCNSFATQFILERGVRTLRLSVALVAVDS